MLLIKNDKSKYCSLIIAIILDKVNLIIIFLK